jgi:hydroxymethylpyrimidine pyrophosphatase-like HAD family hydrolase
VKKLIVFDLDGTLAESKAWKPDYLLRLGQEALSEGP